MDASADRLAFAPPPQPGLLRALVLAVIAHVLLLLALTQGLQWQREEQNLAAEAELWAAVPQQAAPREQPVAPPTPPVVRAPPLPEPPVVKPPPERPVVKPPPEPEAPARRDAEIALEREKEKKRELEKRRQAEAERERAERRKLEAAQKKKQQQEEAARRKEEQAKLLAEARRKEAEQKRKEQEAREAREAREAKRLAQLREDNMRRIQGMAGTGSPTSTGSAAQSSGPSASWGARVQARVRPNIVFTDSVSGNPKAEVEVRMAPDGTIVSRRITKSSGNRNWDDAVLRALDRTEVLPRDVDGRVPATVVINFRPRG